MGIFMKQLFKVSTFLCVFLGVLTARAFPVVQTSAQFDLVEFNWDATVNTTDSISIDGLSFKAKQDAENYLHVKSDPKKTVSIEVAEKLFSFLKTQADIPYDMPQDGCYARAHVMARLLEANGIESRKAFVFGILIVDSIFSRTGKLRWNYHVAPMIQVAINGEVEDRILDPSISTGPLTTDQWFAKMNNENCQVMGACQFRIATKFTYIPADLELENTSWDLAKWKSASDYILKYRELVKNYKGPRLPTRPRLLPKVPSETTK
jgi:hypothetical protein